MSYPTVDFDFLCDQITQSEKIEGTFKVGSTMAFVLKGNRPIIQRTVTVRATRGNTVDYLTATGLAMRHKFIGPLLTWLETNRNWKDGGYTVGQQE